ncbi:lasso RiPP family leader peptide-containing protein [Spirillospora sp. NPDC127200]
MVTKEGAYEAPALVEIGDFAELTLGLNSGCPVDWYWWAYVC